MNELKILKYKLQHVDLQNLELPLGSEILTVQIQEGNNLYLWAMVYPNTIFTKTHTIEMISTESPIEDTGRKYISTIQLNNFVWHVFERF